MTIRHIDACESGSAVCQNPKVLISALEIKQKITELAASLGEHFRKHEIEELLVIGVLKGAFLFTSDLIRTLDIPLRVEFVKLSSYGDNTESDEVKMSDITLPDDVRDSDILIVEDIVDTGKTLAFLYDYLSTHFQPRSVTAISLLNKPSRREVDIDPDFFGFEIGDQFVVGYGLDLAEKYRELDYIGIVN